MGRFRTWQMYVLASAFVLTGLRQDVGFIVLDPALVVVPLCLGLWLAELAIRRSLRPLDSVGILGLLVMVSAWLSFVGALDMMTWLKRAMKITWLFGLYLFLVNQAFDRQGLQAFIRASVWACAAASVAIISQTVARWMSEGYGEVFGAAGVFANGNEAATYLGILVVLSLALHASGEDESVMDRRLLLALTGISALGILFSRSRSGLMSVILVPGLLFARARRVRRLVISAIAVIVLLSLTASTAVIVNRLLGTVGMSGDPDYDEFVGFGQAYRIYLVDLYWTVIKANPVFGIGAGNYGFIDRLNIDLPQPPIGSGWVNESVFNASSHNGFLNWWLEAGTVGFVVFTASVLWALTVVWNARRSGLRDPWWRAAANGTVGGLAVFILTNLTGEFGVSEPRYWLLLALATVTTRHLAVQPG